MVEWRCRPISRFCSRVAFSNSSMFWNVRAMPRPAIRCGGMRGDVLAVEDDPARGRLVDAADQVEDRRLAGAVRADDREDLALLHVEADVVDGVDAAELDARGSRRGNSSSLPLRLHVDLLPLEGGALVEREQLEEELDLQPAAVDAERLEQDEQHDDQAEDRAFQPVAEAIAATRS